MYQDYLILGGAGLVGTQVVRHIVRTLDPRRIIVASLLESEAREACDAHAIEYGDAISFVPAWGNLFVPGNMAELHRRRILEDETLRRQLLEF